LATGLLRSVEVCTTFVLLSTTAELLSTLVLCSATFELLSIMVMLSTTIELLSALVLLSDTFVLLSTNGLLRGIVMCTAWNTGSAIVTWRWLRRVATNEQLQVALVTLVSPDVIGEATAFAPRGSAIGTRGGVRWAKDRSTWLLNIGVGNTTLVKSIPIANIGKSIPFHISTFNIATIVSHGIAMTIVVWANKATTVVVMATKEWSTTVELRITTFVWTTALRTIHWGKVFKLGAKTDIV